MSVTHEGAGAALGAGLAGGGADLIARRACRTADAVCKGVAKRPFVARDAGVGASSTARGGRHKATLAGGACCHAGARRILVVRARLAQRLGAGGARVASPEGHAALAAQRNLGARRVGQLVAGGDILADVVLGRGITGAVGVNVAGGAGAGGARRVGAGGAASEEERLVLGSGECIRGIFARLNHPPTAAAHGSALTRHRRRWSPRSGTQ